MQIFLDAFGNIPDPRASNARELMRWMPPPAGIGYHDGSIFAYLAARMSPHPAHRRISVAAASPAL